MLVNQLLQAYPRLDRNLVEMVLNFEERKQRELGPDYDAESLGIGAVQEPTPEPQYSEAPIISDEEIDRVPCIRAGHPEHCNCAHCLGKLPENLSQLTIIEEEDDQQEHQPGDQQQ